MQAKSLLQNTHSQGYNYAARLLASKPAQEMTRLITSAIDLHAHLYQHIQELYPILVMCV